MQVKVLSDSWIIMFNNLVITYELRERKSFKLRLLEKKMTESGNTVRRVNFEKKVVRSVLALLYRRWWWDVKIDIVYVIFRMKVQDKLRKCSRLEETRETRWSGTAQDTVVVLLLWRTWLGQLEELDWGHCQRAYRYFFNTILVIFLLVIINFLLKFLVNLLDHPLKLF